MDLSICLTPSPPRLSFPLRHLTSEGKKEKQNESSKIISQTVFKVEETVKSKHHPLLHPLLLPALPWSSTSIHFSLTQITICREYIELPSTAHPLPPLRPLGYHPHPCLTTQKLGLREVKSLVQDHTAGNGRAGLSDYESDVPCMARPHLSQEVFGNVFTVLPREVRERK